MEIQQQDNGTRGTFYIEKEGRLLAEMTYSWEGNSRIIIEHTQVSEELKGMGIGKQLVSAAVSFAREKGIRIVPVCPFTLSIFNKVEAFGDVLS